MAEPEHLHMFGLAIIANEIVRLKERIYGL
jgi:hypothetical protein